MLSHDALPWKRWRGLYTTPVFCVRLVDIPELQPPTPECAKAKMQHNPH